MHDRSFNGSSVSDLNNDDNDDSVTFFQRKSGLNSVVCKITQRFGLLGRIKNVTKHIMYALLTLNALIYWRTQMKSLITSPLLHCMKQTGSMLPCVCSVLINHRKSQNV